MASEARPKELPPDGSIDAGLLLLELTRPPGRTYSAEEIAHACGCSRSNIWLIERRALSKLRRAFVHKGVSKSDG